MDEAVFFEPFLEYFEVTRLVDTCVFLHFAEVGICTPLTYFVADEWLMEFVCIAAPVISSGRWLGIDDAGDSGSPLLDTWIGIT